MTDERADTLWTPRQVMVLMVIVTACLCLVVVVCGTMYLLATDVVKVEDIGAATSVGVGSGLVGLAAVVGWVIKVALAPGAES